jgi:hypothetical protein
MTKQTEKSVNFDLKITVPMQNQQGVQLARTDLGTIVQEAVNRSRTRTFVELQEFGSLCTKAQAKGVQTLTDEEFKIFYQISNNLDNQSKFAVSAMLSEQGIDIVEYEKTLQR